MANTESKEEKIEKLLDEFQEQRGELNEMISEVQEIKNKVDELLPKETSNDFRNFQKGSRFASVFEERVKSITDFFRLILDVRREISKTLKDEVELRRKVTVGDIDIEELLDIREMADKVDDLRKKTEKTSKSLNEK